MADISIKIYADAAQAEKEFQSFIGSSERVKEAVEKFQKSFDPKTIDDFIAKNKLAALGVSQSQGPMKGLTAETKGYEKQIKQLISSGLSPQSAEILKLRNEYDTARGKLDQLTAATKSQNTAFRSTNSTFADGIKSIMSYAAAYISLRGALSAVKALTNGLAEQGDEAAKNSRKIGITAESYQELKYAADLANISSESFSGSMEKLTKNLGEAKNGSGSLASFLKKTNPELLAQMTAAKSSEEALKLLSDEVYLLGNAQDRAALATAAFGKSGMDMLPMLENGASDIAKMQAEAKKYGFIMSNEAALASEEFLDSQTRLGYAFKGLITQIGAPLIKPLADGITGFVNWATKGDNLIDTLKIVGTVLASVTTGLIAFLAVTKGAAMITSFTKAVAGLSMAMSANPIGAIIVAVAALIPLIILLVKNWDYVKYKVIDFGLAAKEKMLELNLAIREKVIGAMDALVKKFADIPIIGKMFEAVANGQREVTAAIKNEITAVEAARGANLKTYEEAKARAQKEIEDANTSATVIEEANARKGKSYGQYAENMKAALDMITMTEQQKRNSDLEAATAFFEQRAELETADFEKRIEFLAEQNAIINSMDKITSEQRQTMLAAVTKATENENKKQIKARAQYGSQILTQTGNMLTDLQAVFANFGKQSRELAIALKAVAVAQAIVNTFLGVTGALTILPPPLGWAMAAVTMASGLAAVARIVTTPIPSGQTGLNYKVPDIPGNRNDHHAVNASAGESVSITPRGEEGDTQKVYNFYMGEDVMYSFIQRGIDTGKINLSNKNISGGVFA